jgi:hypothetical protein
MAVDFHYMETKFGAIVLPSVLLGLRSFGVPEPSLNEYPPWLVQSLLSNLTSL